MTSESDVESEQDVSQLADETGASKKRKRDGEGDDSDGGSSANSSDNETDGESEKGSRLAQRIKRSHARSTGLKEVATASSTSVAEATRTSLPTEQTGAIADDEENAEEPAAKGQDVSYPEDPADDEDELEREMLAAFEDGDYDEKAEGAIAEENG